MQTTTQQNEQLIHKYQNDNTICETFFKNNSCQNVTDVISPLRIDNRQYCSPTDYQGKTPYCASYTASQILESLYWMRTGKLRQFNAEQIYAKCKEIDGRVGTSGTFPDLALTKGLELMTQDGFNQQYVVRSSNDINVNALKRIVHANVLVDVNMKVTKDIYDLGPEQFVYQGSGSVAGGHSMVCCGYDDESKMLIMQNHWGTIWGLKGFFLCPYEVWESQCNLYCWYEPRYVSPVQQKKEVKADEKKSEHKKFDGKKDESPKIEVTVESKKQEEPKKDEEKK